MDTSPQASRNTGTGFLAVQVTTANGSIPLQGAAVTVRQTRQNDENVLYELRSGPDGRTPRVSLPAPPRALSLTPEDATPYATYSIEVSLPHYRTASYESVPIFDGITAIQQANLTPLPENGYPDGFAYQSPRPFDGTATVP